MKLKKTYLFGSSLVLAASSIIYSAGVAHADQTWTGATGPSWNDAGNWTTTVPTAADIAIFNASSVSNLATTISAYSPAAGIRIESPAGPVSIANIAANSVPASFLPVTADNLTDVFTYAPTTSLVNGNRVTFTATTLPTGLTAAATYFVVNATATTFQVAITAGGAPVNFTANGTAVQVHGVILPDSITDVLTYGSTLHPVFVSGNSVTFAAATVPAGLQVGPSYFIINATPTAFQVSRTRGGAPVDLTTDGVNLRASGSNATQLIVGASGINMNLATQNLSINTVANVPVNQIWDVTTGFTLAVAGTSDIGVITKNGAGNLSVTASFSNFGGVILAGGTTTANTPSFAQVFGNQPIEFRNGGALTNGLAAANTMSVGSNITVAAGQSGVINMGIRSSLGGNGTPYAITGDGTLTFNLQTTTDRNDIQIATNGFAGTFVFDSPAARNARLIDNGGDWNGFAASVVELRNSAQLSSVLASTGGTYSIGTLTGSSATTILGGSNTGGVLTWLIGGRGENSTYAGQISGTAALTKTGAATLTLTGTGLTYTGATLVNDGFLKINGTKTGAGATTVNSPGTLTGTGSVSGVTTVASSGTIEPGDGAVPNGIGNITHSSLTLATGANLDLEFGAGNDTITVAPGGTLTLNAGVRLNLYAGPESNFTTFETNGTYPIINHAGATVSGFNSSTFIVSNAGGKIYTFTDNGSVISLVVSDNDPSKYWKTDGDGGWNVPTNWTTNTVPNGIGAIAKFGPTVGNDGSTVFSTSPIISLNAAQKIGELVFDDLLLGTVFTLVPGTSGSLVLDNGSGRSNIVSVNGNHFINAPIAVDAEGVNFDVSATTTLSVSGVVSGASAALEKSGPGTLDLTGENTYGGGTTFTGGSVRIYSPSGLGPLSSTGTFAGGGLQLGATIPASSRAFQVSGTSSALIDTNGFDYGLSGSITPVAAGTGGLTKSGAGNLTLSGVSTYTGITQVAGGILTIAPGGSITGGAANTSSVGGAQLVVAGGSLTTTAALNIGNASAGFLMTSGSTSVGALNITNNDNFSTLARVDGGTLSATSFTMRRNSSALTGVPVQGFTNIGLYVTGGIVNISGAVDLGSTATASNAGARFDGGNVTVGGAITIGGTQGVRYGILDVNGAVFTSTDAVTGVQVGTTSNTPDYFYVRAGTATVERIQLGGGTSIGTSVVNVTGGSLYVGSGGIVVGSTGVGFTPSILLGGGILGAKADWTTSVPVTFSGFATVQAADSSTTARNITFSGAVGGTGSLAKTGAGTLTLSAVNTYSGTVIVTEGTVTASPNSLSDGGSVDVYTGAFLNLPSSGTDAVSGFLIDGNPQLPGTYGRIGSTAQFTTERITGEGFIQIVADPFFTWIAQFNLTGADAEKTADPDRDGQNNLLEFGLNGNPSSGAASGKFRSGIETVAAAQAMVLTIPVRTGAVFTGTPSLTATLQKLTYTIQGTNELNAFDQVVTEVTPASIAGLPALDTGWNYRTFRLTGVVPARGARGFLRAGVTEAP